MTYAIIGTGTVGLTLAGFFAARGLPVLLANSRGPDAVAPLAEQIGPSVSPATLDNALDADIIFFAVGSLGRCQSNEERSPLGRVLPAEEFLSRSKVLPLGPGGGAALLVGLAVNEMAFELEVVVQAGVD